MGRNFVLVFNQANMYHADHPAVKRSLENFFRVLSPALSNQSPIIFSMSNEQIFIEDSPLDARINTAKMVDHFKKSGLESISFERGFSQNELQSFIRILIDLKKYPSADQMKTALFENNLDGIKINYVVYKKVTADDEIVSRDIIKDKALDLDLPKKKEAGIPISGDLPPLVQGLSEDVSSEDILGLMAANIVFDEFDQAISVSALLDDPEKCRMP